MSDEPCIEMQCWYCRCCHYAPVVVYTSFNVGVLPARGTTGYFRLALLYQIFQICSIISNISDWLYYIKYFRLALLYQVFQIGSIISLVTVDPV